MLITGVIPFSTTSLASIPRQIPWKFHVGTVKFGFLSVTISIISLLVRRASSYPPAPTNLVTAGAAIIAIPPTPNVSVIALSPISGQASSASYPVKYSPCGVLTGPVNHSSPIPAIRIPNSYPLRHIAVTIVPSVPLRASSITALPVAIIMFRKN